MKINLEKYIRMWSRANRIPMREYSAARYNIISQLQKWGVTQDDKGEIEAADFIRLKGELGRLV